MISISLVIKAQDVNSYLKQISENNPEILAYQKLLDVRILEARSSLNPSDPFVTIGYMPAKNSTVGIKKIWSVNQSFSFPTKYLLQRKISRSTIILAEHEFELGKLMILLDAKLTILDLIYYEKSLKVIMQRKENYNRLQKAWEKMVSIGEATIIDYNKIRMELSSLNLRISRTKTNINMLRNKLLFMNGNGSVIAEEIDYPLTVAPDPENLIIYKTNNHPAFIIPALEYLLSREELKLSKTNSLPDFQIGYSAEILPGETFSGPVGGLSIPLWSNTNRVKTAYAIADHAAAMRDAELSRLKSEVLNEYYNMKALKQSMNELTDILKSGDNKRFLDIALNNGEISITTYFSDLAIMYQVEDRLFELEHEYNKSLATLSDYKLIK